MEGEEAKVVNKIDINIGQREYLLEMLNYEYVIPDEFHECVKDAIIRYATNCNYSELALDSMVKKPQSMAASIGAIRDDNLSLFRGRFAEWLACIEYNALKNKEIIEMTIINPDSTSKADLLHIIKKSGRFEAIPGPDIKCGGSNYVFNQWKKIITSRYDIPMVDMDDVLTTEEGLKILTSKQREGFEQLKQLFPNKKPIKSVWNNQDINRLMLDYLKYVSDGITPAGPNDIQFVANKENRDRIKKKLTELSEKDITRSGWDVFCKKSVSFTNIPEDYKNVMTLATLKKKEKEINEKLTASINKETYSNIKKSTSEKKISVADNNKKNKLTCKGFMKGLANYLEYDNSSDMIGDAIVKIATVSAEAAGRAITDKMFGSKSDSGSLYDRGKYTYIPNDMIKNKDTNNSNDNNGTNASIIEHIIKGHGQHYNTKEGRVWKEKEPFTRGKSTKVFNHIT